MSAVITHHRRQRTLAGESRLGGIGYLTGADIELRFRPAPVDSGIVFVRIDLPESAAVPARIRHVVPRARRTTLEHGPAVVEMVEHVMAAAAGLRIDNCIVEISGREVPGCDGSSRPFVEALSRAGVVEQEAARPALVIDAPLEVHHRDATLVATPGPKDRLVVSYRLDYGPDHPIGVQSRSVDVTPETFRHDLAPSRTFLLEAEALELRRQGVGRRTLARDRRIFGPDGPLAGNPLRFPDECVRHKILDLIGDLALAGADVCGQITAHKSGHQLNAALVRKLVAATAGRL